MRDQGRLIEWFDEQGYGFIQPNDASKDRVFLHIQDFAKRGPRPLVGCALDYLVIVDSKGRFRATQVAYLKKQGSRPHSPQALNVRQQQNAKLGVMPIVIIMYLVVVLTAFGIARIPSIYFVVMLFINIITYALYAKDKKAAQQKQWRVQEQSLHLFSLLGGWPAAWLAQQKLRHKTQKQPFQQIYHCTIVLNIGLTLWLIFRPMI
ncbi:DUF1294 domain-containing protein [Acinetobacter sp. MD2]|uniref:DUF1294 domain-containing protein n=1 Tax=Acinetobacter sp. MD2 TaxID=2600066 RepID=UPI002D1F918A|nr:DUF1294 domain-containing protein [Acinetobacter sp. MD2]MEB3768144.1 cold shock and DUF1294 domain-containing protein [Acinetobacter sp. MD2]